MPSRLQRAGALFAALILCLAMAACGSAASRWQDQYDLGQQYLNELDYEQAIIAFTAAIEIDPNRGEAYEGRGDAHMGIARALMAAALGGSEEGAPGGAGEGAAGGIAPDAPDASLPNGPEGMPEGDALEHCRSARSDYESALDLMEMVWPLVGKLGDVYETLGDTDALTELLERARGTLGEASELDELLERYGLTRGEDGAIGMDWEQLYRDTYDAVAANLGGTSDFYRPRAQIGQMLAPYAETLELLLDNDESNADNIGFLLQEVYRCMGEMDKVLATRQRVYALTGYEQFSPDGYTLASEVRDAYWEYNGYGLCVKFTSNDHPYHEVDPVTNMPGQEKYYTEVVTYTYNEYGQQISLQCTSMAPPNLNDSYIDIYTYDEEGRLQRVERRHERFDTADWVEDYTYEGDTVRETDYSFLDGVREPDTTEFVYQIGLFGLRFEQIARYENGVQVE